MTTQKEMKEMRPCPRHGIAGEIKIYPGDPESELRISPHVSCSLCVGSMYSGGGGKTKELAVEACNSAWCWKEIDRLKLQGDEISMKWNQVVNLLASENEKYRKLKSYVRHRDNCLWKKSESCSCGLKQALKNL